MENFQKIKMPIKRNGIPLNIEEVLQRVIYDSDIEASDLKVGDYSDLEVDSIELENLKEAEGRDEEQKEEDSGLLVENVPNVSGTADLEVDPEVYHEEPTESPERWQEFFQLGTYYGYEDEEEILNITPGLGANKCNFYQKF